MLSLAIVEAGDIFIGQFSVEDLDGDNVTLYGLVEGTQFSPPLSLSSLSLLLLLPQPSLVLLFHHLFLLHLL